MVLFFFILRCCVFNYICIALTFVVIEHCARNVRLYLPDICSRKMLKRHHINNRLYFFSSCLALILVGL